MTTEVLTKVVAKAVCISRIRHLAEKAENFLTQKYYFFNTPTLTIDNH